MDVAWGFLRTALPDLSQNSMAVLAIPHSNAGDEKNFSIINKSKTEFRSCLELRRSLNSVMIVKSAISESLVACNEWKLTLDLLKICKSAKSYYNKQHK